jgi:hypothetical protein
MKSRDDDIMSTPGGVGDRSVSGADGGKGGGGDDDGMAAASTAVTYSAAPAASISMLLRCCCGVGVGGGERVAVCQCVSLFGSHNL